MHNIFCIWSGKNEMSYNRQKNLQSIMDNSGCKVTLITPENLQTIENSEYQIHPAYEYLSLTHKADYLRCYLMHNYGGGYTDVKAINFNWVPYFKLLYCSNYMFLGYREVAREHIASDDPQIRNKFFMLCGCGHFIMKSHSPFTTEWINRLHSILDEKLQLLQKYPGRYHPRAIFGGVHGENNIYSDSKYPLRWNEILGCIIHPLMLKYIGHFSNVMPYPNLSNYR